MFFFGGVGALATVASCYGCIQKPGCLLWGRSTQLRLVLQLENVWEEKNCVNIAQIDILKEDKEPDKKESTILS